MRLRQSLSSGLSLQALTVNQIGPGKVFRESFKEVEFKQIRLTFMCLKRLRVSVIVIDSDTDRRVAFRNLTGFNFKHISEKEIVIPK